MRRPILNYARRRRSSEAPRPVLLRTAGGFEIKFPDAYFYLNQRWTPGRVVALVLVAATLLVAAFAVYNEFGHRGLPSAFVTCVILAGLASVGLAGAALCIPMPGDPDRWTIVSLDAEGIVVRGPFSKTVIISRARLIDARVVPIEGRTTGFMVLIAVSPTTLRSAGGDYASLWPELLFMRQPLRHKVLDGQLVEDLLRLQHLLYEAIALPRIPEAALAEARAYRPSDEEVAQYTKPSRPGEFD